MASKSYVIRRMQLNELQVVLDWAAKEGWNPGLYDACSFYQADPQGFFAGVLDGELIAAGSMVCYDERFAFAGLYIVKPEFRGQNYGFQLAQALLAYADKRITGLDGVLEQVANYEKMGYQTAYLSQRYQYNVSERPLANNPALMPVSAADFEVLTHYEQHLFPTARPNFLRAWITQTGSIALAHKQGQHVSGYAVIRPCQVGYKIGPLFADNGDIAEQLLIGLLEKIPGQSVSLDIPEPNTAAITLAQKLGMQPGFTTARMYRNGAPQMNLSKIYGVTTLELG